MLRARGGEWGKGQSWHEREVRRQHVVSLKKYIKMHLQGASQRSVNALQRKKELLLEVDVQRQRGRERREVCHSRAGEILVISLAKA